MLSRNQEQGLPEQLSKSFAHLCAEGVGSVEEELVVRGRRRGGGGGGGRGRLRRLLPGDDVRQLDQGVRVDVIILFGRNGCLLGSWVPK